MRSQSRSFTKSACEADLNPHRTDLNPHDPATAGYQLSMADIGPGGLQKAGIVDSEAGQLGR
jgi:hypothetical protein